MVRPGLDLVGLMINLGLSHGDDGTSPFELPDQDKVARPQGHAIEARIYAEIPHLEFKPAPGLLQEVKFPEADHIRLDTWVETGTTISAFYDPMIAKLITHGADRDEAQRRLNSALKESSLLGTHTNLAYLVDVVNCDEFVSGDVTTKFLDSYAYRPNCIEVVDGGISTSVQDGRPRLPSGGDGIPRSGPADELAAKVANLLVGNPVETELLEATVSGPSPKVLSSAVVAVTGATADIYLDDAKKPMWTHFVVPAGSTLEIGACESGGNRTYISVRGGFPEIPFFAGSKSTFSAAKFGGIQASPSRLFFQVRLRGCRPSSYRCRVAKFLRATSSRSTRLRRRLMPMQPTLLLRASACQATQGSGHWRLSRDRKPTPITFFRKIETPSTLLRSRSPRLRTASDCGLTD